MLCDPTSGEMINRADQLMAALPDTYKDRFSYELILSEIECNTSVCKSVHEAISEIVELRQLTRQIGRDLGFQIGIGGTHPTADPLKQSFVQTEGYQWVTSQMQAYARQNITFATHVHVAVPDSESAIHVTNGLRRWIPPLLAISANSPFFAGVDTGMLSSRSLQFGIFPRTNIPMTFKDFAEYEQLIKLYIETGAIAKPRHVWWKLRPHLEFGTIEFRMFDVQRSLKRLELLIALSQALVYQSVMDYQSGKLVEDLSLELLNDGLWKATRWDFNSKVVDTAVGDIVTMGQFTERMAEYCLPALQHFGSDKVLVTLQDILKKGSEAIEQKNIYTAGSGFSSLKHYLMDAVEYSVHD